MNQTNATKSKNPQAPPKKTPANQIKKPRPRTKLLCFALASEICLSNKKLLCIFQGVVWLCRSVTNGRPSRALDITVQKKNIFLLSSLFMVDSFNWKKVNY